MSTCYGICRQAGGTITVESVLGEGTTFRVWLPAVATSADAPSDSPRPRPLRAASGHVLVAEDNAALRALVTRALCRAGYSVTAVPDGGAGWEVLKADPTVVAVVSDLIMPHTGGLELARRARALLGDTFPIVLVSGYTESVTSDDIDSVGAHFMAKPFSMSALTELLVDLVQVGEG